MGLAVVHGIIKKHNGLINVYSEPGEGTIFNLYLPAKTEYKANEKEDPQSGNLEKYKGTDEVILIVEDEKYVLHYLENILQDYGYKFYSAQDGEEAREKFIKHKDEIELLISDVILPGMDGIELADTLKKSKLN